VVLLWDYNGIWPDLGRGYRLVPSLPPLQLMDLGGRAHNALFVAPLFAALALSLQRRRARWRLLSLHVVSLMVVSMLYFGDTRYRAPYDGVIIVLAMQAYVELGLRLQVLRESLAGWRAQRFNTAATSSSPAGSGSGASAASAAASAASLIR
jgi:hypothetical protein